jgi:hypothetical protein
VPAVKRGILTVAAIALGAWAVWIGLFPQDWQNWLGFSNQATGQYAFASGPGPMMLTAAGMGSIITGLWHAHNCHVDGCWSIGRHKINGTPYCNTHHEDARHEKTAEQLLSEAVALLQAIRGDLAK